MGTPLTTWSRYAALATVLVGPLCVPTVPAHAAFSLDGSDTAPAQILTTQTFVSVDTVPPGDTVWLAVRLDLEPSWHVNSARPLQDFLIPTKLELALPDAARPAGNIVYPPGKSIPLLGETMSVYESGATIFAPVVIQPGAPSGALQLSGTLHFQGCDDKSCIAPDEAALTWNVLVSNRRGSSKNPELFAAVIGRAATSWSLTPKSSASEPQSDLGRLIAERGTWGYVLAYLLAFGTGLLLSFSPCTYPMIPITVSIFAGQARGVGRGFILSIIYVLTMAVLYGIMGTIVASVGGVFGAWLAHPAVVAVIVAVFVVFALSMFGLYELQVPESLRNRMAGKGGEGIGGAIALGAIAALVVSPCVGPFVAGIMLYVATTGSAVLGFTVLFTFALGLGAFFVLIGTFSSAIQALPRAGEWMESVKKFFGFVLLLMALYFARTLISTEITAILAGLLFLAAGVFGGGFDRLTHESGFFPRLKKAFGILCTLLGIYLLVGYLLFSGLIWPPINFGAMGTASGARIEAKIPWTTDLDAALTSAKQSGKPVLIDTWATWCANCYKLDKETWSNDQVAAEASRFVPLKLQLENSDAPQTKQFLQLFGLKQYSLPTIILIDSRGQVHDVVYGFVDAATMLRRLQAVA